MAQTVSAYFMQKFIPTYAPDPALDLPMFFEKKPYQGASGRLYPLPFTDSLSGKKVEKPYNVGVLENEYIRVEVLPEIGGKLHRGYDKVGGYDFIYHNSVIKPAMIGLAGPWVSGGIEFNWPQHHRPTTFLPVEASLEEDRAHEKTIWLGEVEPFQRMKGMVGITVCPGRSFIKAKVRIYNRTPFAHPFMWWANLAVPVNENYQVVFPPDVEYVNDHDRRAVVGWPMAKGVYRTARPFDYGEGTDLSRNQSVKVPSSFMISEGQSDMDFVSGYDHGKGMGVVAWADHAIAPGKKLFHWGVGEFGEMWCSNLTDADGPYVELMTGVFTDNQPDFAWIFPYETKEFEQYWYPIRGIGAVKNATIDAAVNLEVDEEGKLFVGVQATGTFPGSTIRISQDNQVLWSAPADLSPSGAFTARLAMQDGWAYSKMSIVVADGNDVELVSFSPPVRGEKTPIKPRNPVVRPSELATVEELYVNGLHLEQYKQHCYEAADYYREGLSRDPGDIRCNTGMARKSLKDGLFAECVDYCDRAIERLVDRNEHPKDVEAFYLKVVALRFLGSLKEARASINKVIWNYAYRSAGYYELACIKCMEHDWTGALSDLNTSISTNAGSLVALNLKAAILRRLGRADKATKLARETAEKDRLDLGSRLELYFCTRDETLAREIHDTFDAKAQNYFDPICGYMHAGLYEDALAALDFVAADNQLAGWYRAYLFFLSGKTYEGAFGTAHHGICFPARLEDIPVLAFVADHAPAGSADAAESRYLLGCLLYDRFRYAEAAEQWKAAVELNPGHAYAWRNLAIAYFDKFGDKRGARSCMEQAFKLAPASPRLLYELQQLLKNSDASNEERLALYAKHDDLLLRRDDCYLDKMILLIMAGRCSEAIDMANARTFHIYEGGEGKLTSLHAWMHILRALELEKQGKGEEALGQYRLATAIPASYGEAKSYFAQEAHVHYFRGRLLERAGADARPAYEEATVYKAAVTEVSLFRALALQKLARFDEARAVLQEMLDVAESTLANPELYKYFGVGAPTPQPFEYDIEKINRFNGNTLKAYALLGFGRGEEASKAREAARLDSPNDFRIFAFDVAAEETGRP